MEADEEKTDDSSDYYGGIKHRMEEIEKNIKLLIQSVRESTEYKEYKKCEEQLKAQSELFARVEEFCARNYYLQNDTEDSEMLDVMRRLKQESEELHKIPVVHAYLQSELNLCRLMQEISLEINGDIGIHIPI